MHNWMPCVVKTWFLALLLLASSLGRAALIPVVTVGGVAGWSCYGVPGFGRTYDDCLLDMDFVESGLLQFTYRLDLPDSDPRPGFGNFRNAIVSFDMTIGQLNGPPLEFTLASHQTALITSSPDSPSVSIGVNLREKNGLFPTSSGWFSFYNSVGWWNPNVVPNVDNFFSGAIAFVANVGPVVETDWMPAFSAHQHFMRIPEPATWRLLLVGLALLTLSRFVTWPTLTGRRGLHP